MSSYRPIDSKREEFRKYLERAGVMDALTKVLVSLYEEAEKPDNALDYVRSHLGGSSPDGEDVDTLKAELDASMNKIQTLEEEVSTLKEKLAQYEPPEEVPVEEELPVPIEGEVPEEEAPPPPPEEVPEEEEQEQPPPATEEAAPPEGEAE